MNKRLTAEQLDQISTKFPLMTRKDKLLRWAKIVRQQTKHLAIFHNLESVPPDRLGEVRHPESAFALAASDSILRDAGMPVTGTARDAKTFFELSQHELHEFSCDCGGAITNTNMADRIERLAARK